MRRTVLGLAALLLGAAIPGCTLFMAETGYHEKNMFGGYTNEDLGHGQYMVTFSGNGVTHRSTALRYALRRARELCLDAGYDDFGVVSGEGHVKTTYVVNTYNNGATVEEINKPDVHVIVQCTKTEARAAPADQPTRTDASGDPSCMAAFGTGESMTAIWAQWYGGNGYAEHAPSETQFMEVCAHLPYHAKQCLNASYASDHRDDCIESIGQLPVDVRHAIDHFYVTR